MTDFTYFNTNPESETQVLQQVVQKEIETLPLAAIDEVVYFIRFIKLKLPNAGTHQQKKSMYGVWKNESFYMASDFDEPLEDFAEYM